MDDEKKVSNNNLTSFTGKTYRITILTERLIRFEYNKDGYFIDDLTQLVQNRTINSTLVDVEESDISLKISNKYFVINYIKEKNFQGSKLVPTSNLKVEVVNTDKVWYYNHPEIRNYGGANISLDDTDGKVKLNKGLYSSDGFASINDSNSLILNQDKTFSERKNKGIDIYLLVYRKDFGLALKDYFQLTGFPPLLPRYALGNWWSRNIEYTEEDLKKILSKFKKNDIPLSVWLLDKPWRQRKDNKDSIITSTYNWNKDLYKEPKNIIDFIHGCGIKIGLNINPIDGIDISEPNFDEALQYININGKIPFMPYDLKFIETYFNIYINPLKNMGIDLFWLDYYDLADPNKLSILNHYHYLNSSLDKRGIILSRNGMIASHRYPICYSGNMDINWNILQSQPFYTSSSANIGLSWWSHDIGGYNKGIEDEELYQRSVELGCFSPIFRFHSDGGRFYKREPWRWNVGTTFIAQKYMQLRHRLIPYLYSESYKYHKIGVPIIQPIYYNFPYLFDDTLYRNQYYFGSELHIAPIINKKEPIIKRTIHKVYLPEGIWYDFLNGKKFVGGKNYVSFYRDDEYPVFAKAGAIIPLSNDKELNKTNVPTNIEIQIFPGKSNIYYLYEDDGISNKYKDGFYIITALDYNYRVSNHTLIIRPIEGKTGIIPSKRNYLIRFRNTRKADEVIVYLDQNKIDYTSFEDGNDFIIELKDITTTGQLTINCKGEDIEIDAAILLNEEMLHIISDLQVLTDLKEEIAKVILSDLPISKKRIAIKRLKNKGLEERFIKLFLRLLEYVKDTIKAKDERQI